jgi:Rad3-related DNA helicase
MIFSIMDTSMPSSIRCSQCDRIYSIHEYEEDKFCRDCSKFLEINIRKIDQWRDLFPYEPYPAQVNFMEDVYNTVSNRGVLLAEACNGFGKTISALSCILPTGKQIIYTTRTHEQVRQVLLELKSINEKSVKKFSAVNLASRSFLCINHDCRKLPNNEAQALCRTLRRNDECSYISEIEKPPKGIPRILDSIELIKEGRKRMICPYFLSRRMARDVDVIVTPYPYIFNPVIRLMTGIHLEKRILILDEGHNIDQIGQDIFSDTLTERGLSAAAEEIRLIGKSSRYINRLGEHLLKNDREKPRLVKPKILFEEFERVLRTDIQTFIEGHAPLVETIRSMKLESGNSPISYLNGVLGFFDLIQTSQKDKYVGLYTRNYFGAPIIEYRCLDPILAIDPVVSEADGVLIMSGTLSPIEIFAEIIGQESAEKKIYPPIQKSDKIRMTIDRNISSLYRERTSQMILKIGRTISEDLEKVSQGALIFFTQRGFMNKCIEDWTRRNIIKNRRGILFFGGKRLFREGRDANQNREIVALFKQKAVSTGGAVMCCVFRGRNSEGSNFPGDQARGITLVGVPYANYGDPLVKAQINYFDNKRRGLGNKWYTMDAFRVANQSLGRGIRGKDDWCHYWMLDRRYYEHRNLISKWAIGEKPILRKQKGLINSSFKRFTDDTIIEL